MEIVVGIEGSGEGNTGYNAASKHSFGSAPLKHVADPVVYKLVRVDFDGSLIPATDDELMEVENFLELEESEVLSMSDIVKTVGQGSDKNDTSEKPLLKKYKGSSEDKNAEVDEENLDVRLEESSLQDGISRRESAGSKPDFSWLKGEIDLDRLTIRELQETFRATFGRKTFAKDKMWLKQRIAMGLTNSCDISVRSFIIKDGKFLKKEDICKNVDFEDSVAGEVMSAGDDTPVACQNVMEDTVDGVELRNYAMESVCGSEDAIEQLEGAKRVRKPTKRYIEELSDKGTGDSRGKLMPAAKCLEHQKAYLPVRTTSWGEHTSAIVTRPDSIGGSGVQVPYVSRARRCRPRKSVIAFTKFLTSPVALTSKTARSPVSVSNSTPDDFDEDKVEVKSVLSKEAIASEEEKEKCSLTGASEVSHSREPSDVDSRDNAPQDHVGGINSDDNVALAAAPTAKGGTGIGMRRKHHRAWTLTEVLKLVDGVSKFGAGRWSEIKRLSFSSSSYRTSVDLKDKWRNLLKASFASLPSEKGVNPRMRGLSPIPAPILVKVRELAEINGQAPRIVRSSSANSGSSVNENRSGL